MKTIFNNYSVRFSHFPAVFSRAGQSRRKAELETISEHLKT